MQAWVINLDKRPDRFDKILKQFKDTGIELIRFSARGSKTDDVVSKEYVTLEWNTTLNSIFDKRYEPHIIKKLSNSERYCAMSHINIWEIIVKNKKLITIICEDDITISDNILSEINKYLKILPSNWDIFYLDYITGYNPTQLVIGDNKILKNIYSWSAACYIVTLEGAKKLLKYLPVDTALDNYLSKLNILGYINTYLPYPALSTQTDSTSNIEHT